VKSYIVQFGFGIKLTHRAARVYPWHPTVSSRALCVSGSLRSQGLGNSRIEGVFARDRGQVTGQGLIEMEIFAEEGEVLAEIWEDQPPSLLGIHAFIWMIASLDETSTCAGGPRSSVAPPLYLGDAAVTRIRSRYLSAKG